jgi:hypothetical protein
MHERFHHGADEHAFIISGGPRIWERPGLISDTQNYKKFTFESPLNNNIYETNYSKNPQVEF